MKYAHLVLSGLLAACGARQDSKDQQSMETYLQSSHVRSVSEGYGVEGCGLFTFDPSEVLLRTCLGGNVDHGDIRSVYLSMAGGYDHVLVEKNNYQRYGLFIAGGFAFNLAFDIQATTTGDIETDIDQNGSVADIDSIDDVPTVEGSFDSQTNLSGGELAILEFIDLGLYLERDPFRLSVGIREIYQNKPADLIPHLFLSLAFELPNSYR